MKHSLGIITTTIAVAFASCSEDHMAGVEGVSLIENQINLSASYPTSTRATDAGFEDGDEMGVYILDYVDGMVQDIDEGNAHAENVAFVFSESDNSWKSQSKLYWTDKDTPADIIGYYPYISEKISSKKLSFSIQRRQDIMAADSKMGGYESSDFLWAKSSKVMPTSERVDLCLHHVMAGVRVTLAEGSGFSDGEWSSLDKAVFIPNVRPSTTIDIENCEVGEAYGEVITVSPYQYGSDWRAVVAPQSVSSGLDVIDVMVGQDSYHLVKESSFEYVSGKLASFTITVNKRADGGLEFTLSDESITMWLDDSDFREGVVRNYICYDVEKRGTLKEIMIQSGMVPSLVTGLKLSGEIDESDFAYMRDECTALRNLNLSDVTVWDGHRKNVIPERAMYMKKSLSRIVFPKILEIIGSDSFYETGLMGNLVIPEGVTHIGESDFYQDNMGVDNLNHGAFARCHSLYGELTLPSTLLFIEDDAFALAGFTGTLNIPESVVTIGNGAFVDNRFSGDLIIPESVENIGCGAFAGIPFTGNLVLPKNIKTIYASTFEGCGFSGVLSLPEGLRNIEKYAFAGCGFRGELELPASVQRISNGAFKHTKISGLALSDNLCYIGNEAFAECRELRGSVTIPPKVQRICEMLFSECSNLNEIVLHKDILSVGGAAFYRCTNLSRVVCENPEPPMIDRVEMYAETDLGVVKVQTGPFDGLSKANVMLEVPKQSVNLYKESDGWNELKRISEYSGFICRPSYACALCTKHKETLIIDCGGEWEVIDKPQWCDLSKTSGKLKTTIDLTFNELSKGSGNREGKIVFKMKDADITTECSVRQYDYIYNEDECVILQKASVGSGIDILFLGDGWDAASIADGSYLDLVTEQMEAFFGIEPYSSYRNRFNVYASICLSQESGVNTTSKWYNTRFSTFFSYDWNMQGNLMVDDAEFVFDYAVKNTPMSADKMNKSLIIMTLNSNEYGSGSLITENGSAIAICCSDPDNYPMDTRGIIQHEACGHAFGKLAEERIIRNNYISEKNVKDIKKAQSKGWYQNISLSGKLNEVNWTDLIFDPNYSDVVDIFEGGYGYSRGVFRAEINSCMNYGIPYFSAAARLDIMRRILEYSGEGFTMEKFYATDSDKWGSTGSTRAAMPDKSENYVNSGMHHPVRIIKSKKY